MITYAGYQLSTFNSQFFTLIAVEWLITLFEGCMVFTVLSGLLGSKYGFRGAVCATGTYCLILEVSKRLIFPTLFSVSLFCFALIFVVTISFCKGSTLFSVINAALVTAVLILSEAAAALAVYEGLRLPLGLLTVPGAHRILVLALVKTVQFLFLTLMFRLTTLFNERGSFRCIAAIPLVSLPVTGLLVFMLILLRRPGSEPSEEIAFLFATLLLYSNLLVYHLVDRSVRYRDALRKYEVAKQLSDIQTLHSAQLTEASHTMREMKHDLLNQLNVLSLLLQEKRYEQAAEYIQSLGGAVTGTISAAHSGCDVLDALLSHKMMAAKAADVKLDILAAVPDDCTVEPVDMCALAGNLIDNALEACVRITDPDIEKKISFSFYYKDGFIYVKCSNPYSGDLPKELPEFVTSKDDKLQHGLGLKSVQRIVKKYNGRLKIMTDNQIFEIHVLLCY